MILIYLFYLGDYVLVEPIEEGEKVKAEIVTILYKEQIKYIQEEGKWWDDYYTSVSFTDFTLKNSAI